MEMRKGKALDTTGNPLTYTLNQRVLGSSPSASTTIPLKTNIVHGDQQSGGAFLPISRTSRTSPIATMQSAFIATRTDNGFKEPMRG